MAKNKHPSRLRRIMDAVKRLLKRDPEPPEDPHSYITARRKPRPGSNSAAAVAELPE
jgi:hypothetical protein